MNKINKKVSIILIVLLCFVIGGTLSFESLAKFTKKFDAVNKKVSLATFKVEAKSDFEENVTIKPGDTLSEDTITLTNDNEYPVEFTITLKEQSTSDNNKRQVSQNAKDLIEYLTLTIDGVEQTTSENNYTTILNSGEEKVVSAKIEWIIDESTEIYEDKIADTIVNYTYDIKAKQKNTTSLYKSNFESQQAKNEWKLPLGNYDKIIIEENNGLLKLFDSAYTSLDNLEINLNNGMAIVKSEIEVLVGQNNESENGFNIAYNFGEKYNSQNNNFTYQFYKAADKNKVFLNLTKEPRVPGSIVSDDTKSIDNNYNFILVGEFNVVNNNIVATLKINTLDNKTIYRETFNGGIYNENDKFFINISSLVSANGLKIKNIAVEQVN